MKFNSDGGLVVAIENIIGEGSSGLVIPSYDRGEISYFGDTNNINTITFKKSGVIVGTLYCFYVGGMPTTDDAKLEYLELL